MSIRIIAALMFIVTCSATHAGQFADLALAKEPTRLLGDRLRVRMPVESKVESRSVSIMAAQESPEEETRVVFDLGEKRLVLMAYETFSTAGPDFATRVRKMDEKASNDGSTARSRLILDADGFRVYQTDVRPIDTNREAIVIASAYVVNTDKTVQVLFAYANPPAAADFGDVQKLCSQFLMTLTPGAKRLPTESGTRKLEAYSKMKCLTIDLPEGFVTTVHRGPDFLVHRIHKIVPFGEAGPSIGMYLGNNPTYHHRKRQGTDPKESKGKLLRKNVSWFQYSGNGNESKEAICPCPEIDDNLQLHVFLSAPSGGELLPLDKIAASLRFVDVKKPKTEDRKQSPGSDSQKDSPHE